MLLLLLLLLLIISIATGTISYIYIFSPGEEEYLKDKLGHLPFDVNSEELINVDKYPSVLKVRKKFEIYQEAGEIIFVPSGWYHQVTNVV